MPTNAAFQLKLESRDNLVATSLLLLLLSLGFRHLAATTYRNTIEEAAHERPGGDATPRHR